jgi:hypothetical protein
MLRDDHRGLFDLRQSPALPPHGRRPRVTVIVAG